jgi:succinate dehydrogenase/fumarate reductase flavoprotein subunit
MVFCFCREKERKFNGQGGKSLDKPTRSIKINFMEPNPNLPAELMAELQAAAEKASQPIRDPEEMRRACLEMDRIREEIRQRHGVLDSGLPAIREFRDRE